MNDVVRWAELGRLSQSEGMSIVLLGSVAEESVLEH